jgi:acid stress-induced BolA-like protein IbaG/YrbA
VKDTFYKKYDQLINLFYETGNPEIIEELIDLTTKQVEDEKINHHLFGEAFQKLIELEKVTELTPRLKYRKAVLLLLNKKPDEAYKLFKEVIQDPNAERPFQDRSRAYILKYFDTIRLSEQKILYAELKKTTDDKALHMLEELQIKHNFEELEIIDNETEDSEYQIIVFTSESGREYCFNHRFNEIQFRLGHSPENYDLYLDQVRDQYFVKGNLVEFKTNEIRALFVMAMKRHQCNYENLYEAVHKINIYDTPSNELKKKRDYVYQLMNRLRKKLLSYGIVVNETTFSADTSICLLCFSGWKDDLIAY